MNKKEYNILEAVDQMINHNKIIISAITGQRVLRLNGQQEYIVKIQMETMRYY